MTHLSPIAPSNGNSFSFCQPHFSSIFSNVQGYQEAPLPISGKGNYYR
jgi:hypothetical protein